MLPATRYFTEQVLRKRPYLTLAMCEAVIDHPLRKAPQDGSHPPLGQGNLAK